MGGGPEFESPVLTHEIEPSPFRVAFIFAGQGLQSKGMGLSLYENSEAARATFEEVDDVLGYSLSQICFEDPRGDLKTTRYSQPALVTVGVAAYRAAMEKLAGLSVSIKPVAVAGVSLGELTSLVASGVVPLRPLIQFIDRRGLVSEEYEGRGGMVSVFDLSRADVDKLCEETGVEPAIYYSDFTVFSGLAENIGNLTSVLANRGVKARPSVNVPFHSQVLEPAKERIRRELELTKFRDPDTPLIHGPTGELLTSGKEIKDLVPNLLTAHIDTIEIIETLKSQRPQFTVECGPRPFLSVMLQKHHIDLSAVSIHDAASLSFLEHLPVLAEKK